MNAAEVDRDQPPLVDGAAAAAAPRRPASGAGGDDLTRASQSAAQTCFPDGLHSIFSFLSLREFGAASRCCLHWSAAASSQPPLRLSREATADTLQAIADSHIARHIDLLVITSCMPRQVSMILSLCCRLPYLTRLTLWWRHGEGNTTSQLPSTLRELHVILYSGRSRKMKWSSINSVLALLGPPESGHTPPPLTSLRIHIDAEHGREFDAQIPVRTLRRLLALKESLTELVLAWQQPYLADESWVDRESPTGPARWTQAHIDVFRQMTRLEKLDPFNGRWSDEDLVMLCAEPAPAHLRLLPLTAPPITAAGCDALARLPLTEVVFRHARGGVATDPSFLCRMPTLLRISLGGVWHRASPAEIQSLVGILAGCTQVTDLAIPMANAHLCELLPSLTNLRKLQGLPQSGVWFGGLSFASSVSHLAHTLEELDLFLPADEELMPLDELRHLHALRNLRHLDLTLLVADAVPEADRDQAMSEFDTDRPETFRRDIWPHMQTARLELLQQEPVLTFD